MKKMPIEELMGRVYKVLIERFGEPIGDNERKGAGVSDERNVTVCKCGGERTRNLPDGSVQCRDCKRSWMPVEEGRKDNKMGTRKPKEPEEPINEKEGSECALCGCGGATVPYRGKFMVCKSCAKSNEPSPGTEQPRYPEVNEDKRKGPSKKTTKKIAKGLKSWDEKVAWAKKAGFSNPEKGAGWLKKNMDEGEGGGRVVHLLKGIHRSKDPDARAEAVS